MRPVWRTVPGDSLVEQARALPAPYGHMSDPVRCLPVADSIITSSAAQVGYGSTGGNAQQVQSQFVESADSRMSALERERKVISIKGLRKEFVTGTFNRTTKVAVDGLDVNFYEGSISILLGHNGAGTADFASALSIMCSLRGGRGRQWLCRCCASRHHCLCCGRIVAFQCLRTAPCREDNDCVHADRIDRPVKRQVRTVVLAGNI